MKNVTKSHFSVKMSRWNMLAWGAVAVSGFVAYAILQPGKELSESETEALRKKYGLSGEEYQKRKRDNEILMETLKKQAGIKDDK